MIAAFKRLIVIGGLVAVVSWGAYFAMEYTADARGFWIAPGNTIDRAVSMAEYTGRKNNRGPSRSGAGKEAEFGYSPEAISLEARENNVIDVVGSNERKEKRSAREQTGQLESMPENLRCYFDYAAFARDCELGGDIFTVLLGGKIHVFSAR